MIEDIKVGIDNYNAEFSCIRNKNKLLSESYLHYSPKSYVNPFLLLCGNKKINIIYNEDGIPVFCQFDKNENIERLGINPNESVSCLKVIGDINEEIDFYINSINSFFDEQDKKYGKSVKKRVKSNSKKQDIN